MQLPVVVVTLHREAGLVMNIGESGCCFDSSCDDSTVQQSWVVSAHYRTDYYVAGAKPVGPSQEVPRGSEWMNEWLEVMSHSMMVAERMFFFHAKLSSCRCVYASDTHMLYAKPQC